MQPFRTVCLERLREYCDVIEISVEYLKLNREHFNNFLLLALKLQYA